MADLPSGTVTFLFTDIESSSARWEADPETMATTLARHDAILTDGIESAGGSVFKHLGDGMCAAFSSAPAAVGAAVRCQELLAAEEWGGGARLKVRMGLHTGEAVARDGDFFGPPVNRAARVMGTANGDQVVCSAATATLCPAVGFRDAGVHELAGVGAEHLYVVIEGSSDDRPLRSVSSAASNLVSPMDSFVGRSREVDELGEALGSQDLVTLVGVGGVGKTRLATETAAKMSWLFPDGVWLCELAGVVSGESVAESVAEALGATLQPDADTVESMAVFLERRRVLVILDNCEHVLSAAVEVAGRLAAVDGVTVLATSREPLGIRGEQVWPLSPLEGRTAGVELFVARARERDPQFSLVGDDAAAVADICGRLDGIPLAIELAAARTGALSPTLLAERLGDRFRLLRGGRRGERHQTLRDTVRWSYELLNDGEARLFDRLSVFAGGLTLDAAEKVCSDEEVVDELDVIDLVSSLVDKSMAQRDTQGADRFTLLETLRQFAEDQLDTTEDAAGLRDLHSGYFRDLAVDQHRRSQGPDERVAWQILGLEWDNLRAAYQHATATNDIDLAAEIVASLGNYAEHSNRSELGTWADALLSQGIEDHPHHGRLCGISASFAFHRADYRFAQARIEQLLASDSADADYCHASSGPAFLLLGDVDAAERVTQQLLELAETQNRPRGIVNARTARMTIHRASDDWDQAVRYAESGLDVAHRSEIPSVIALAHHSYGMALVRPDPEQAITQQRLAIEATPDDDSLGWMRVIAKMAIAEAGIETDDLPTAMTLCRDAVTASADTRHLTYLTTSLEHTAVALARAGEPHIGAQLLGSSSQHDHRIPVRYQRTVAHALGDTYEQHLQAGKTLSLLDAAELATATIDRLLGDQPPTVD